MREPGRPAAAARTRHPAERAGQLLDAALIQFVRDGYTRTRVCDICKIAGVSIGTFYLHFADKADLIARLVELASEEVPAFEASSRASFERDLSDFVRSPRARIWKAWREALLVEPKLRPAGTRVRNLLHARMKTWIREVRALRGVEAPAIDDRTAAWLCLASMHELIILDGGEPPSHALSVSRALWHMLSLAGR